MYFMKYSISVISFLFKLSYLCMYAIQDDMDRLAKEIHRINDEQVYMV